MTATSAEAFCRYSFGKRYVPWIIASFLFCSAFTGLMQFADLQRPAPLMGLYLFAFFILVLFHIAFLCRPSRVSIHSQSCGKSWPLWQRFTRSERKTQALIEPAVHIIASIIVLKADQLLSMWLLAAGLCLFAKEAITGWNQHIGLLDTVDARIEGERMNTAVRGTTSAPNSGDQTATPVVAAQRTQQQQQNSLPQIIRNLDPALRRMIATEAELSRVTVIRTRNAPRRMDNTTPINPNRRRTI